MEALDGLGLSQREQSCYRALLFLGSSSVGKIIERTGIPSSKIYEVLGRLAHRGLVTHISRGKVRHYQARDPDVLLRLLDEQRRAVEEELPKLRMLKTLPLSNVTLLEGQRALLDVLKEQIEQAEPKAPYLVFALDRKNAASDLFFKNVAARRKEKGLDVRVLRSIRLRDREKHTKVKIRYTKFDLPQGVTIVGDVVLLISWGETPVAVRIQNAQIAQQWRAFFLGLWDASA